MKQFLCTLACVAMLSVTVKAEEEVKSGLQAGDSPPPFYVADVTGPSAGKKLCYRCKYGSRPVVSIFAREMNDDVKQLVSKIDAVVGKNKSDKMSAFVVLLSDDPDAAEKTLKTAADEAKVEHTPLTVFDGIAGPRGYKVAEKADVTVMMWVESEVKVNHAFSQGQLSGEAIAKVVKDTGKILN